MTRLHIIPAVVAALCVGPLAACTPEPTGPAPGSPQNGPPPAGAPTGAQPGATGQPTPGELPPGAVDAPALHAKATAIFQPLPEPVGVGDAPLSPARVSLGRMLYFEPRLSVAHDISCASCHDPARFGADGQPTSPGHMRQRGSRNSPTTLNAALHTSFFWDGRATTLEEQAKGPILNPVEMGMPEADAVDRLLQSIPGYEAPFDAAFPGEDEPRTLDNAAVAIADFERTLLSPAPFDTFLAGDLTALPMQAMAGLETFIDVGCAGCHSGVAVGGKGFSKLGIVAPYDTTDPGRAGVTGDPADAQVFKVPSLRNITRTGPYLHDGSVGDLEQMVRLMATHQLGRTLSAQEAQSLIAFLDSLTGEIDADATSAPPLPASGPGTPSPSIQDPQQAGQPSPGAPGAPAADAGAGHAPGPPPAGGEPAPPR